MNNRDEQLCSETDCFNTIKIDELTERYADGSIHILAQKCNSCTTSEDMKKLKAFRKRRRKAEQKAERNYE